MSPLLFNVYVSDLSDKLNAANAGCSIGNSAVNHLFFADDLCLIYPSAKAIQKLINVCEAYGTDSDMIFCAKKTNCMYFPCNRRALNRMPPSVKLLTASLCRTFLQSPTSVFKSLPTSLTMSPFVNKLGKCTANLILLCANLVTVHLRRNAFSS